MSNSWNGTYVCIHCIVYRQFETNGVAGICIACRNNRQTDELLEIAGERRTRQFGFGRGCQIDTICSSPSRRNMRGQRSWCVAGGVSDKRPGQRRSFTYLDTVCFIQNKSMVVDGMNYTCPLSISGPNRGSRATYYLPSRSHHFDSILSIPFDGLTLGQSLDRRFEVRHVSLHLIELVGGRILTRYHDNIVGLQIFLGESFDLRIGVVID